MFNVKPGVEMRDIFPGYFRDSDENQKRLWEECIFVLDANILLNLYRYSDATRNEFLNILKSLNDRLWIPHRAVEEYLNNRLTVIDQQEKSYEDTVKTIDSLKDDLDNARQHPFVSRQTMAKVSQVFDLLKNELKNNKSIHTKRISDDEIKTAISEIFKSKVGSPYDRDKLEEIIKTGEERYVQKIPPGFKDAGKSNDSEIFTERCRKYGDLIVWNQIIDQSKETDRSVILITDDKKEDWWERFKGKTIGPRPELIKEFYDETSNSFRMYQADRFLELARDYLNQKVSPEIVEEIREVRRRERLANKRLFEYEKEKKRNFKIDALRSDINRIQEEIAILEHEQKFSHEKLSALKHHLNKLRHNRELFHDENISEEEKFKLFENYLSIQNEYEYLMKEQEMLVAKDDETKHRLMMLESELARRIRHIEQENAADS